jgi:hypothetical protein
MKLIEAMHLRRQYSFLNKTIVAFYHTYVLITFIDKDLSRQKLI